MPPSGRGLTALAPARSYDQTIRLWDYNTGEQWCQLSEVHTSRVFRLQFSDTMIVSSSQDYSMVVWDFAHDVDPSYRRFLH